MNQTDIYYRALLAYRRETGQHRACVRDTRLFAEAEGHGGITVKRALCTVDEAWILAIEEGLVHIEKAIKEERQFIHSNGEVVPIEKVKSISKDSVQHLARHAELITRAPQGDDIIPDSLYTVERLSDYAVYENRFLYMLLCYLRDFVSLRYQSILELTNRYEGVLSVERSIKSLNRQIRMTVDLNEVRRDDPYLREHNPARPLIERMDLILKTILAFLATPLMESAGKVALLKPPITKTNVLKMDNNFKGAVALYDYIIAYEGEGYTVTETETRLDPFHDDLAEDMAEAERLISFLTYRYGLRLTDELKAAYETEEARRRDAELRQRTEQLASVRRRLAAEGEAPEAYILHLEKHARALQNEVDRIPGLTEELERYRATEARLLAEAEARDAEMYALREAVETSRLSHEKELRETEAACERRLGELQAEHESELSLQRIAHEAERSYVQSTHEAEMASLTETYEAREGALRAEVSEAKTGAAEAVSALAVREEEVRSLRAQLMGLRAGRGEISEEEMDALTEEENFDELERELAAFIRFYESQWSRTKRAIRRDMLNLKSIKRQMGKK